eukprot:evm.model.scf_1059.5 EVM.evm.TU.scf_1059.5   scf_1059:28549-38537(-)
MAVSTEEFATAVGIDAAIALVVFAVFAILRRLRFANRYYAPKRYLKLQYRRPKRLPSGLLSWMRPMFAYEERDILEIAGMDALMYLRVISFGTKLFLFLGFWNLVTVLPTNLSGNEVNVLLRQEASSNGTSNSTEVSPVLAAEGAEENDFILSSFDKLSITNIEAKSDKFWVHLISAYACTFYILWLLWRYHTEAVHLRIQYLATTKKGGESHTVLVTDIPGCPYGTMLARALQVAPKFLRPRIEAMIEKTKQVALASVQGIGSVAGTVGQKSGIMSRNERRASEAEEMTDVQPWKRAQEKMTSMTYEDMVTSEFKEVYPEHEVERVRVVHDSTHLDPAVTAYNNTKRELEDLVDEYTSKIRRRREVKPQMVRIAPDLCGAWAKEKYPTDLRHKFIKVDKLEFLAYRLEAQRKDMEHKQLEASELYVGSAFVTFKSRWSQVVAATSLHHHDESVWQVQPAPGPEEVYWPNIKWRSWEKAIRTNCIWMAFGVMCFTFMIPVAAIQALIEIERLEKYDIPGLNELLEIHVFRSLLVAILPGLALKIFLALLPSLLVFMNKVQGMVSLSAIDFGLLRKYFLFQVLTIFFGSFIFGSFTSQLEEIIEDPGSLIDILGTAAPQTASFFCTYILVEALLETPISLLRLPGFVIYAIKSYLSSTERAKARLWQDQTMTYGDVVPDHTMVILLGVVFAAINPIITVTALAYFLVNTIAWRYQVLYVYKEEYQSGGKMWVQVFDQVLLALLLMQAMIIGLLGIKKFAFSLLVIPLPFITLSFKVIAGKVFTRPLSVLSLRGAADLDRSDKSNAEKNPPSLEEMREADRLYLSPNFKVELGEYEDLLRQARTVGAKLKGEDVKLSEPIRDEELYWSAEEDEGGPSLEGGESNQV